MYKLIKLVITGKAVYMYVRTYVYANVCCKCKTMYTYM